jgi:hypothetical protein
MKIPARVLKDEPILIDRAAHCFGTGGQAFMVRARIRAKGILTLTEETLTFTPGGHDRDIEIPVHEIQRLGMGRWHEGTANFIPVLKITYRSNLILGVQVAHPERWIEAIEGLIARRNLPALKGPERVGFSPLRHSRVVLVVLLVLALLATALPAFLTWVHKTSIRNQGGEPSQNLPSRTAG